MEETLVNELKKRWLTTKEIRLLTGWSLVRITQLFNGDCLEGE